MSRCTAISGSCPLVHMRRRQTQMGMIPVSISVRVTVSAVTASLLLVAALVFAGLLAPWLTSQRI